MAKKKARFKKGSAAAKRFMASIRPKSRKAGKRKARKAVHHYGILKTKKTKKRKPSFSGGINRKHSTIILSEGSFMKKPKSRKRHAYSGKSRKYSRSRRSRRGLLMGGFGGGNPMKQITGLVTEGAIGAAGALGTSFLVSKLPATINPKLKAGIPILVAIGLVMLGKKIPQSKALAFGAAMSGIMALTKQFVPALPMLAGVESAPELDASEQFMLGGPQSFDGAVQEYSGANTLSPADI
jgi:hypothetical protein